VIAFGHVIGLFVFLWFDYTFTLLVDFFVVKYLFFLYYCLFLFSKKNLSLFSKKLQKIASKLPNAKKKCTKNHPKSRTKNTKNQHLSTFRTPTSIKQARFVQEATVAWLKKTPAN
jgi:hypothetical protein